MAVEVEFIAGTPNVGKTGYIAGRPFQGGFYQQPFKDESAAALAARYCAGWNAHPVGSNEGKKILRDHYPKLWEENKHVLGKIQDDESKSDRSEDPESDVSTVGRASDGETENRSPDAATQGGEAGGVPDGDGAGTETKVTPGEGDKAEVDQKLVDAVTELDPENNLYWTSNGQPTMAAIEEAYGSAAITRNDVEQAVPGYNRDVARAAKTT